MSTARSAGRRLTKVTTFSQPRPCTESACFTVAERRLLLATPGIGYGVIDRIECAGVYSLRQLCDLGVDVVVDHICESDGNFAWRNRKRPLLRALAALSEAQTALSD